MDFQIKHLLELYKQKRFSQVGNIPMEKVLKIDSQEVAKIIKKNYSYLTCTCESSGKTGHNSICRHKQFFIVFPILKIFNTKFDELIRFYKKANEMNLDINTEMVLDDLEKLRRLK